MSRERILALDILRGFALLGILFGNLTWFTGWAVTSPEQRADFAFPEIDAAVSWSISFLVSGKFYGIFSLLFGAGFAIFMMRCRERGDTRVVQRMLRRLAALFVIGALHGVFFWFGDIVSLYAVFGVGLLFFSGVERPRLLWMALLMLSIPIAIAALWLWLPAYDNSYGPYELLPYFGTGTYAEILDSNWPFLVKRWFLALVEGRPFKFLGLFLLGYWAVQKGIALNPREHTQLLRKIAVWGLAIGIPANVALALVSPHRSEMRFLHPAVDTIAVPSLAVAYCAIALLLLERPGWKHKLQWMAAPGRMTLTNYLGQSVICMVAFYGCGFSLWGKFGAVWIVPFAFAIFFVQTVFSALWLRRYRQGPAEFLWRRATYG